MRRTVALKIIKLGMDTRAVVARFEAERQALAMMDHPNIARVFDGGATETGRPYFVMELVRGVPITAFCDEHGCACANGSSCFSRSAAPCSTRTRKGIIHRDLKPSNILVALAEDRPVPKVIDFGIAKATREPLTEKTLLTRQHVFVGTPAYMSPEQVGAGSVDIDTRSDIYSLGALLYELLSAIRRCSTRRRCSRGAMRRCSMRFAIDEPPPPSQRVAALAGDARARRGDAAPVRAGTADRGTARGSRPHRSQVPGEGSRAPLRNHGRSGAGSSRVFLRHEPVLARPATLGYRAAKFVRRHRRGVVAAAAALTLLAGIRIYHTRHLAAERDRAQFEARKAAKVSELLTELLIAGDPFRTPTPHGMLEASAARVRGGVRGAARRAGRNPERGGPRLSPARRA